MTKASVSAILKNIDKQEFELEIGNPWQRANARLIEFYLNEPNNNLETIAKVLYGLQDLQVRDYAMGIMLQSDSTHKMALQTLIKYSSGKYRKLPITLMALWDWENGNDMMKAQQSLLQIKKYNLANLLLRCMAADWPPKALQDMRKELHLKVSANIFGQKVGA
jgi:hypothetical protein